jgi:flagellar hook-basal body complex protein FliE
MDGIRGIGVGGIEGLPDVAAPSPAPKHGPTFADALGHALGQVEQLQLEADAEAQKNALGAGNLHETALALEKADVSMRLVTKVRNKILDAYQEVMRMSV